MTTDRELRDRVKPAPDRTGSLVVDGLTLAYEVHGDDPAAPLAVFLPGVGFPRVYFRPLAGLLRGRMRCVLLDTRGAGDSEGPAREEGYDLEGQAADVAALLDHLGERRAWLVGHSLGSNIAVACAARFPDRVLGVVVISAALDAALVADHLRHVRETADPELLRIVDEHERRGPVFVGDGPPEDYGVASSQIYQRHVVRGVIDTDVLWSMRQAIGPAGALWGKDSAFRITGLFGRVDQRDTVGRVGCPLVAVAGRDDEYARTSLPFFEKAPRGRVVLMPDSLHHAHVEEPVRVAEIVLAAVFPEAPGATPPLRLDVRVDDEGEVVRLSDELTGFSFELPAAAALVLPALGRPIDEAVTALRAALDADDGADDEADEADEDVEAPDGELRAAVDELVADLAALGLLQQGLARAEIERLQARSRARARDEERFAEVKDAIARAYDEVPLHRRRMDEARVTPDDLHTPEDLKKIPPMGKADVRMNFPDGLVRRGVDVQALLAAGAVTIGATSGTTDERLQVLFDWSRGGLPARARELWDLADDAPLARGAVFTTPLCAGFECHLGATPPEQRTRGSSLTLNSTEDLFSMSDASVKSVLDEMREHRPDVLFVHPWYAAWLLQRAAALGLAVHRPTVVLTSYQLLTHRHRRLLGEGFGAPVFSYWGATDLGGPLLGVECHERRLHVREDHVYVEVDDEGGGRGTALVTLLGDPVMPLVRYRISDVVRAVDEPCACALGGEWRTVELYGRARDRIGAGGRTLDTKDVDDALGDHGPDFWRLVQTAADAFTLEVLGGIGDAPRERLQSLLGGARLKVVDVKRFSPERSLKFRQTVPLAR